jgi:hypothetical protein
MAIIVREAELPADREALLSVLLRNRDPDHNSVRQARFEWSYFTNPYGRPRAWLAIDQASDRVIGAVGAFPRRILVGGKPVLCWNGGDSSIDREYRTLGPAMRLRGAVKKCVEQGEMTFLYSYPVDAMRMVLERIGHVAIGQMPRYRLVITVDRLLDRLMGSHVFSRFLAKAINPLMQLWPGNFCHSKGLRVRLQSDNRFGGEYDRLFERCAGKYTVVALRDSRFLNWRFLQSPLYGDLRILRLETEDHLNGYAIIEVGNDSARILDFLVEDDKRASLALLGGALRFIRAWGINTVSLRATEFNPLLKHLKSFGFLLPDTKNSAVVVCAGSNISSQPTLNTNSWFMTEADRDV